MSTTPHAISWFEIPVTDFARAKAFYEHYGFQPSPTHAMTLMLRLSSVRE